ncbi:MAG TPA: hypothetical protein VJS69_04095 [Candidatus Krumholzibacteria bacterium]|nr:hypothetical protein [Candidatus Krumholzibacteria bacterium]
MRTRSSNMRWLAVGTVFWLALFGLALLARLAHATPSSTFWAPATPYVQPYGVLHVTYDTYFGRQGSYPIDTGLTMGIIPGQKLQAEAGFDFLYATLAGDGGLSMPLVLNAKVGAPEDVYFRGQPAWSFGIYGVGFKENVNDANVLHFMLGKTLAHIGYPSVGVYYGLNEHLFRSPEGDNQRAGIMAGWTSPTIDVAHLDKIAFCWDIQTGHSAAGATGAAVYAYFTPSISLETGPVFFFEKELQPGGSSWMWSMQLDIDLDLHARDSSR